MPETIKEAKRQIEQLKNTQRDKEEEIALIIEQIDAKENLIDSIYT